MVAASLSAFLHSGVWVCAAGMAGWKGGWGKRGNEEWKKGSKGWRKGKRIKEVR